MFKYNNAEIYNFVVGVFLSTFADSLSLFIDISATQFPRTTQNNLKMFLGICFVLFLFFFFINLNINITFLVSFYSFYVVHFSYQICCCCCCCCGFDGVVLLLLVFLFALFSSTRK